MSMITGKTTTELYINMMNYMRAYGEAELTRGGMVKSVQHVVTFGLIDPQKRVLHMPSRKPNPAFHLMESVWMLAGRNDVDWLKQFNSHIGAFADEGEIWGAYGHRWLHHWDIGNYNQIEWIIERLVHNFNDRQCVLTMWDPASDLDMQPHSDRPCNTQIMFRVVYPQDTPMLTMLVCNRSNDMIWGALGSNIVHFTILQEYIANSIGIPLGPYRVVTNNLHIYERHWHLMDELATPQWYDLRTTDDPCLPRETPVPVWSSREKDLTNECDRFIRGKSTGSRWLETVCRPVMEFYLDKERRDAWIEQIADPYWRRGCLNWHMQHASE